MVTQWPRLVDVLKLDCLKASKEITNSLRQIIGKQLHKKGVVVGRNGDTEPS